MHLLVLGGNRFLSREVAAAAALLGHDVTCANRGLAGTHPPGVRTVRWDRSERLPEDVREQIGQVGPVDVVVDVARQPSHVRQAVAAFPDAHWVFVSTISVYADDTDPSGPGVGRLHPPITDDVDLAERPEAYGGLKVACEALVADGTDSAAIVRPGLVVGPSDVSGRFAYWARRRDRVGDLLAPGAPDSLVQTIDVRDLADWIVRLADDRTSGTFDAVGEPMPMADFVAACAPEATLVWVDQASLESAGVEPWAGPESIPVWLPRPEYDGMLAHDPTPATAAGLVLRPLAETCRDTAGWLAADPAARIDGISEERERELLARFS